MQSSVLSNSHSIDMYLFSWTIRRELFGMNSSDFLPSFVRFVFAVHCLDFLAIKPNWSCIDDEHQFETATRPCMQLSMSYIRLPKGILLQNQFSGDVSPTFSRIWKIIVPLNSANFSTSDRMDEVNFWNPKFFVALGSPFGVLDIWWGENPKAHLLSVCLPLAPLFWSKTVSCRLWTGYRKNRRFGSGSAHVTKFPIFFTIAESATHTFMGLAWTLWRSVVM